MDVGTGILEKSFAQSSAGPCLLPGARLWPRGRWRVDTGQLHARHRGKSRCHCLIVRRLLYKILVWTGASRLRARSSWGKFRGSRNSKPKTRRMDGECAEVSVPPPSVLPSAALRPARRRPCVGASWPASVPDPANNGVCVFTAVFKNPMWVSMSYLWGTDSLYV